MDFPLFLIRIRHWGLRSGLSLLDHVIFSGANFILTILLARWLDSERYGAFSLAFVAYIFFTGLYNAFILEPMSILGVANYSNCLPQYILAQIKLHFVIASLLGGIMISIGIVGGNYWSAIPFFQDAIVVAGYAFLFMVTPWIIRRQSYLRQTPSHALLTSVLYALLLGIGIIVIYNNGDVTNLRVWFGLIGFAGLFSSIPQIVLIWKDGNQHVQQINWSVMLREQWMFGRWMVIATILYSISMQAQLIITADMIDLQSAGALRALLNFTLPVAQAAIAISAFALPTLSAEYGASNFQALRRKGYLIIGILALGSCIYAAILIFWGNQLEQWAYNGRYSSFTWIMPILGISSVLIALSTGYSIIIRAFQRPAYYLFINIIGAVISVASAVWMTRQLGVSGAVWSSVTLYGVLLIVNMILYRKWFSTLSLTQ